MAKHLFLTEKRKIPVGDHIIRLLILRPLEKNEKPVPGVLWVHGGGYQSGSAKDIFVTRALSLVVKFGAVLVAPDYRLSKRHPEIKLPTSPGWKKQESARKNCTCALLTCQSL